MATAPQSRLTALPSRILSRLQWEFREWRTPSRASFLQEELDAAVLDEVNWLANEKTLDVGCAFGFYLKKLAEKGVSVVGLDVSTASLEKAASAADVPLLLASGDCIPVADSSFDSILCHKTMHLFASPENALREFARVLCPGGRAIISCSRVASPYALAQWAAIGLSRNRNWEYQNRLGPSDWIRLANRCGFEVDRVYSCNLVAPIVFRLCDRWIIPNEWMRRLNRGLRRISRTPVSGNRPRLLAQDFVLELRRR